MKGVNIYCRMIIHKNSQICSAEHNDVNAQTIKTAYICRHNKYKQAKLTIHETWLP